MRPYTPESRYDTHRPHPSAWQPTSTWKPPAPKRKRGPWIHIVLFAATLGTTAMTGAYSAGVDPLDDPWSLRMGLPYALPLMSILLIHELGHYFVAKYHRVRASLPYFLPAPPVISFGTFGAFIRMKSPPTDRRTLFDVGAAGPWAGLLAAIPAVIVGLRLSEVRPLGMDEGGMVLGDSLLFTFLSRLAIGTAPSEATILLHPLALAGWFGLFVTFFNLMPASQLDGGHVAYALFGRAQRVVARLCLAVIAVLAIYAWTGWLVFLVLISIVGVDHPPTFDSITPLNPWRRLAGWLTIGLFAVTFMPAPLSFQEPSAVFEGEKIEAAWHPPARSRTRFVVPFRASVKRNGIPS